jgi:GTP-binding protein
VIEYADRFDRIVMADIPGLIEGAHDNRGLGHQFLRHIERCTLLVFIIDMAGSENRKPWDDFKVLERELRLYSKVLAGKPRVIVANKLDLPEAAKYLQEFQKRVPERVIPISCYSGDGLENLRAQLWSAVKGPVDQRPKPPVQVVHELPTKPTKAPSKAVKPTKPATPKAKAKPVAKVVKKDVVKAKAKPGKKPVMKKALAQKSLAKKVGPKSKTKRVAKKPAAKAAPKKAPAKKKAAPVKKAAVRTKAKKK